ncbi:hypothetical protein [Gorillibacterium sp. sgz5001074]|uniref:hypothetical protein n=1 Tax=Gorillibacterium sp. sgz5001074 TaxID=3446695 RepID=UPI003F6785FA
MADGTKRTGGEPVFDTDRAWDRFERLAAREPAPAFWRQAEEKPGPEASGWKTGLDGRPDHNEKDGVGEMKQTRTSHGPIVNGGGGWHTEKPVRRRLRRLTAGVAAAALIVGLFTTPLGDRALAFMQTSFRVQHLAQVGLTADDMTTVSELLDRGSPEGDQSFALAQYGTLTQSGGGKISLTTWEEAEQRMGAPLLKLQNPSILVYQPAGTLTLNLNVKAVNRLFTRLGGSMPLPAEADGKAIRLHVPEGVTAQGTFSGKMMRLLQFGKPELRVESGINVAAVREAVLGLPVLPDNLRTKLAAIGDWQSTLPVPAQDEVTTSLRLGGHDAIMTVRGTNRVLFWLEGDRMGLLVGDLKDFPAEAAFQRAAEELVRP